MSIDVLHSKGTSHVSSMRLGEDMFRRLDAWENFSPTMMAPLTTAGCIFPEPDGAACQLEPQVMENA
jgi:hypothetical protein